MAISDFSGSTFVCFTDLCGFKALLRRGHEPARAALDHLYKTGYSLLKQQHETTSHVEGIFVSDSGILFVRPQDQPPVRQHLCALLTILQDLNRSMLSAGYMLKTSVSYGEFRYEARFEFDGMEKNLMFGEAYVAAFLDSESTHPKIVPGQCRVLTSGIPCGVLDRARDEQDPILGRLRQKGEHLYYYWMCERPDQIEAFEVAYQDAYSPKYHQMVQALRSCTS